MWLLNECFEQSLYIVLCIFCCFCCTDDRASFFFFRLAQTMSKVPLSFLFSITPTLSSLKLVTGTRQGIRASPRQQMGMLDRGTKAEPCPEGWPREAGQGDRKAARQISLRGAGYWIWNHYAVLEPSSSCGEAPLSPSIPVKNRLGWNWAWTGRDSVTPTERGWGKAAADKKVIEGSISGGRWKWNNANNEKCNYANTWRKEPLRIIK